MTRLVTIAHRLRKVRRAQRRFLDLWLAEHSDSLADVLARYGHNPPVDCEFISAARRSIADSLTDE